MSTLLGRRRYLPELKNPNRTVVAAAERMAVNMPIQGTAADIIKIAMVRLHKAIQERGLRSRMILQVHDELIFEVPEEELAEMKPLVLDLMENALPMSVHLKVDLKVGPQLGRGIARTATAESTGLWVPGGGARFPCSGLGANHRKHGEHGGAEVARGL